MKVIDRGGTTFCTTFSGVNHPEMKVIDRACAHVYFWVSGVNHPEMKVIDRDNHNILVIVEV